MQKQKLQEDEIDLKALFITLWGKKIFILIFTFLITVISTIYVFSITPIYEAKTTFKIGNINNQILIKPNILIEETKLNAKKNFTQETNTKLFKINRKKRTKDLIDIVIISNSIKDAKEDLLRLTDSIISSQNEIINTYLSTVKNQIKLYTIKLKSLETEKNVAAKQIQNRELKIRELLDAKPNTALIHALMINTSLNKIIHIDNQIEKIKQKIQSLERNILPENIVRAEVLDDIISSDTPIKPKKQLIITVATITGFILSIFLVFFMQFIKTLRKEEN